MKSSRYITLVLLTLALLSPSIWINGCRKDQPDEEVQDQAAQSKEEPAAEETETADPCATPADPCAPAAPCTPADPCALVRFRARDAHGMPTPAALPRSPPIEAGSGAPADIVTHITNYDTVGHS